MSIIVLHGDDVRQSYSRLKVLLNQAKSHGMSVKKILPSDDSSLAEKLVSQSIFNEKVIYVIENINQFAPKELKWLKENYKRIQSDLIIYLPSPLSKAIVNSLPKEAKIEEFGLPKFLWKFLESFYPGNVKNCINLLYKTTGTENIELVFSLLARHLKNLYLVKLDKNILNYPSWRLEKLSLQTSKFKNGKIEKIISEMAKIDVEVKTSKVTLSDALDFLISTKLE